jgi:hypothetical protein
MGKLKAYGISGTGAMAGALGGWLVESAVAEVTGHHITTGLLELVGAVIGLLRLDRRLKEALQDTLSQARNGGEDDYRQVKSRIEELTQDLPELREILGNLVDAGLKAQRA